jgi:molybdate transport system regulatory protein
MRDIFAYITLFRHAPWRIERMDGGTMHEQEGIALEGSVWMTVKGEHLGGASRVALLAKIAECGSITQAAKAIKMSYKAAWDAIDSMNNLAGVALVERVTGGKGGGGTRLTARGAQLVANFALIESAHARFVRQLGEQADDISLLRRISMKTSARNQFSGTVTGVKRGSVNDEITLDVAGGQPLVAIVSQESTDDLGLVPGIEVFALIDASSIILLTGQNEARFSARNQIDGRISRIKMGAVNTEVVLALAGGGTLAATITNESATSMQLAEGSAATALFKASAVMLAVPA